MGLEVVKVLRLLRLARLLRLGQITKVYAEYEDTRVFDVLESFKVSRGRDCH